MMRVSLKPVSYTHLDVYKRQVLDKKYKTYFGKDDWKGSVYDFYRDFLLSQKEKEYDIDIPKDSFCLLYTSRCV